MEAGRRFRVLLDGGQEEATGKQQLAAGCSLRRWGTEEKEAEAEARRQQLLPAARANAFARVSR
jgi:hypothetical protein